MGLLTDVALAIGASLVAAELWAHAEPIARWFITRAVRRLPEAERARREEEWLAHLEETPGALRKFLHGVGCWSGAPAVGRALAGRVRQHAKAGSASIFRAELFETFAIKLVRRSRLWAPLATAIASVAAFAFVLKDRAPATARGAALFAEAGAGAAAKFVKLMASFW
jgi:hypothetical protein